MNWLYSLFSEHSAMQAVIVVSLISAIGLALGKIRIAGISLGVTFVFFIGIMAGHIGITVDPQMLNYAESFGLIVFVYALGLQVGPGFFGLFRKRRNYSQCSRSGCRVHWYYHDGNFPSHLWYFSTRHGRYPMRCNNQYSGFRSSATNFEANGVAF